MQIIAQTSSPDGALTLTVIRGQDGEIAVGFEGGSWHTHPDLLALWLEAPVESAVDRFVDLVTRDELPIILSTDGGRTLDPWISDNLPATLKSFGPQQCVLRYWSGKGVDVREANTGAGEF